MNNIPGVYSIEIEQGNIINQDMIDQLRPKMTKRQVLYIMGSSMLVDVFHQKRWNYLYSEQPGGEPRRQKRLSLFFDGDELIGVQGDFRPSSLPVTTKSYDTTIEVPKRDLDKTLWGKMKRFWGEDEAKTLEELNGENFNATESDNEITETKSGDKSNEIIDEAELPDEVTGIYERVDDVSSVSTEPDNEIAETSSEEQSKEVSNEAELADEKIDNTIPMTETPVTTEESIDNTTEKEDSEVSTEPLTEEKPQELEEVQN